MYNVPRNCAVPYQSVERLRNRMRELDEGEKERESVTEKEREK